MKVRYLTRKGLLFFFYSEQLRHQLAPDSQGTTVILTGSFRAFSQYDVGTRILDAEASVPINSFLVRKA